ncbi:hypothetical protein WJX73_004962 [Symbiochloris irregularis]|uniref:VWFA domain-containing protein n=1 Tax=Symbiochloris irregularis TaxID=706552 RepID=A0AAW1NYE3_9CHLO
MRPGLQSVRVQQRCKEPYGSKHDRHWCLRGECPEYCPLCVTLQPHQCQSKGVCEIRAQPTVETRTFRGQRSNFEYAYKIQQVEVKQICCKPIPSGQLTHGGPHTHTLDPAAFHYCGHPCPMCGYRCTKPVGHPGLHKTQHGNMLNAKFISVDGADINIAERKYAAYTDGTPEGAAMPKDELTHAAYWEHHLGFEDPTPQDKQREFALCGVQCGSDLHDEDADEGRPVPPCELELWHQPQPAGVLPQGEAVGYISANGHFFKCTHGNHDSGGACHTVFIIDRSGSMAGTDTRPCAPQLVNAANFSASQLGNKLGVVYEAILAYTSIRAARSPQDLISFVAFDTHADIIFERQPVSDAYLHHLLSVHPRGGTQFTVGLHAAFSMLQRIRVAQSSTGSTAAQQPIFILLTDSEAHDGQATLSFLQQNMAGEPNRLDPVTLHALGFGAHVNGNFMSAIATLGNGSFQTITHSDDIGRLDLLHAFEALAERPHTQAALLAK